MDMSMTGLIGLHRIFNHLSLGKIKRWGFCSEICNKENDKFRASNLNILQDEECTIFQGGNKRKLLRFNNEFEICAGKKLPFPKSMLSFTRRSKKRQIIKKQKDEARMLQLHYRPTKYTYIRNKHKRKITMGTPRNYPFDWILGGSDSCHGDLGGPLWRNIKKNDKVY